MAVVQAHSVGHGYGDRGVGQDFKKAFLSSNHSMNRAGAWTEKGLLFLVEGVACLFLSIALLLFLVSPLFAQTNSSSPENGTASSSLSWGGDKAAEFETENSNSSLSSSSSQKTGISDEFFSDQKSPLFKNQGPTKVEDPLGEGFGWLVAKVLLFLGLLGIMGYGFYRFSGRKGLRLSGSRGLIRVMGLEPIAPNRFLQVVDVAGKVLVLGVTDQNIQCLAEITDADTINSLKLERPEQPLLSPNAKENRGEREDHPGSKFVHHLQDWMDRKGVNGDEIRRTTGRGIEQKSREFLRGERDRLKRMAL